MAHPLLKPCAWGLAPYPPPLHPPNSPSSLPKNPLPRVLVLLSRVIAFAPTLVLVDVVVCASGLIIDALPSTGSMVPDFCDGFWVLNRGGMSKAGPRPAAKAKPARPKAPRASLALAMLPV